MANNLLYQISKDDLEDTNILNSIYENKKENYYVSDDFSVDFYITQAKAGFISTSIVIENKFYLLPEIQYEYALLDFKNLHIGKKVRNLLNKKNYHFKLDKNLNAFFEKLNLYHKDNWLINRYEEIIYNIFINPTKDFEILIFSLYDENDTLIAAEIGYKIDKSYTSLTGFCNKDKRYNNWGKLQMTLTANYLRDKGFLFWNLGHPYMQYKFDLGATLYSREEFLKRWQQNLYL